MRTVARIDPRGMPSARLAVDEDLVPEPRLVVRLELRQVEVRRRSPAGAARRRCGTGTARSRTGCAETGTPSTSMCRLDEVPATGPDEQRRGPSPSR